jgi:glutamine amidotransferase
MCELLAMSCRHPAKLTVSLAALADRARVASKNQDGWGIGYYQGRDVALYRDTTAANHAPLVDWLMHHGPATRTAIGYIRHSTQGDISLANTGPFQRELGGRVHTFIHNGNLRCSERFRAIGGGRFQPVGETDSELAFCELLENIAALPHEAGKQPSLDTRMAVVSEMARQFRGCGPSNFMYGDGDVLFVHADQRYQNTTGMVAPPALHLFECSSRETPGLVDEAEPPMSDENQKVILLATVPLSDNGWQALGRGELLALRDGVIVARADL